MPLRLPWRQQAEPVPVAAEDAAEQVFAQALAALPRNQETGGFRSWLYAITPQRHQ